ncbi:3' terminal RNA ribose 2'-O-methyltransferase Hen1 [Gordonia terrae]|uniref:Small RNA 2'-O-methyltransferase n=2 Tax=Gordonia terrae TaxID=2055 RepID=A0AAD0KCM3_9ACTN|nr:3' terminal RNA ribose 2'-O-methyltransferase Hen1 [Gordonia terrae]ANY26334.1 3' terminal RNA ribose 2'-O-methyltransferase Hen1 [Gordonia terrae]AWO87076.1 3' terminal RNA ribose 2'-O-methyltransferase Hen1 [Gordonia terrae]VTR08384.1 3' terminal RNA ribose 2'-O-methyltransferase Hen1 [Clostridioides difficile]VTS63385.1 Trans-aconitate methyltransferase [Gordonia terrae]
MLLTISAERSPTLDTPSDLGFLLHKHPEKVQAFDVYGGTAHVFYPEVDADRCTAAMVIEVDPISLVRGRSGARDGFALGQYVNDRPYVASSLLAVAMGKVFRSALHGRCAHREELADSELDLTIALPVVPGDPALVRRLFEPMGWAVTADAIDLDATRPEWGAAPLVSLTLVGSLRLADALNHLYVLLPVLDDAKHYWVGDDEVDKLIRAGSGWLAGHPERELITHRYLAHQRGLKDAATQRLVELDDRPVDDAAEEAEPDVSRPLVRLRHDAVLDVVQEFRPTTIVDLGCGPGALLGALLELRGVTKVIGTDVSDSSLSKAARRLHVDRMTERQSERLTLLLSSLQYEDDRLAGLDLAIVMEVIEHIDPPRLPAVVDNVFGTMRSRRVVVTTPNSEYNVRYPALVAGGFRHPDHRFEWTREEFGTWARSVGESYGYAVDLRSVGECDEELGSPTQMAVFTELTTTGGTAWPN